jgi:hypothetical protein
MGFVDQINLRLPRLISQPEKSGTSSISEQKTIKARALSSEMLYWLLLWSYI